jgi:oligoribonuclease (3'-5' exoribonuclease)
MFTMKSEMVDWPSLVSDDLVQSVDQKICERRRFTILELSCQLPHISSRVLYEIMAVRLSYHKFCARWLPKMLTGVHKTQRMASAFVDVTERYSKPEYLRQSGRPVLENGYDKSGVYITV